ncbi:DNA-directed RNA polymerase subunit alpha C-terminal domain-containing protein [Nonomuraea candida]|uniref:DNA-directed RNA polymerase subunit alpha C-terminal domain-containing protein n=1 Tax=Nonomuraea candida TaxID=359159 RepID=UPI0005B7F297|nr:DNA-directed RNA polymerase subunit alpha C-terminal domain-containing protein [Nonomuraea candida]
MSTTTLPEPLKKTAVDVAAAHTAITSAIDQQKKAAHERNLALFVLYYVHGQKKVAPLTRKAGIHRVDFYKLLKKAPNVSTLPELTQEEADEVIAEQVQAISDSAVEEELERERRIRGVLKLSQASIDGEPFTNADIARVAGMTRTTVGVDLDEAKKRGYSPDDEIEPGASAGMIPLTEMAERLGVPRTRLLTRVDAVRRNGGTIEGLARVGRWVQMADPEVFTAWWERLRLGWVTMAEFAASQGISTSEAFNRLRHARKQGLVLTTATEYGGVALYDPQQLGDWWAQYEGRAEAQSRGYDDEGRRDLKGMATLLGITREQAKQRVRAWRERDEGLPPHVVDATGRRWFEPVEFAAKVRGVEHLLGEPVAEVVPARAVRPLNEADVESVKDLLYLGEERLEKVPGLGPKSVEEIRRRVREAGLIFK